MMKTTTTFALLGFASATKVSPTREEAFAIVQNKLKSGLSFSSFAAKATPLSSDFSATATADPGQWLTAAEASSCSDTGTPIVSHGYEMGFCTEVYGATSSTPSTYVKYNCTQNTNTGVVSVKTITYDDSVCTNALSTSGATTYAACSSGITVTCTQQTDPSSAIADMYSSGLMQTAWGTSGECVTGDTAQAVAYYGAKGCSDGTKYNSDTIDFYLTSTCSGDSLFTFSYSSIFPTVCMESTNTDDDDDDDDDVFGLELDNVAVTAVWSDDGDDDCFHVESKIDYKGVEYTYEELKAGKEPECTVPHSPSSKGVVISTSCDKTVRVTDTHLMATTKGFQLAYSLKAGDVLFGDYDKEVCTVQSVEKEKTVQQYFGLNCVHSEVLASGLRASTFGDFHTLPSWYMTYVGSLVGTDVASSLGEYIAEWYFQK